jgi:hypothetical protein
MLHHIKIEQSHPHQGTVQVGELDVANAVRGYSVQGDVGSYPLVTLFLRATAECEGRAAIQVDPVTKSLLLELGWTPPDHG